MQENFQKKSKKRNRTFLIIIMIIAFFVLIVSLTSLYTQRVVSCGLAQSCTIPLPYLIPIMASVGLLIGSLVVYLMIEKISQKDKKCKETSELIKKLIDENEYKILKLISKNNKITQSKIVKETGLTRLKVFRIIEKLKYKGIIEKQENKHTRIIELKDSFRDLFIL